MPPRNLPRWRSGSEAARLACRGRRAPEADGQESVSRLDVVLEAMFNVGLHVRRFVI